VVRRRRAAQCRLAFLLVLPVVFCFDGEVKVEFEDSKQLQCRAHRGGDLQRN
jgi:hypothetical protein